MPPVTLDSELTLRIARDTTGMNAALLGVAPESRSVDLSPTYAMTFTAPASPRRSSCAFSDWRPLGPGAGGAAHRARQRQLEMLPVTKVESGAAVVISTASRTWAVRVVQMPSLPAGPRRR